MKLGDLITWKADKDKIVGIIIKINVGSIDILNPDNKIVHNLSPSSFEVLK